MPIFKIDLSYYREEEEIHLAYLFIEAETDEKAYKKALRHTHHWMPYEVTEVDSSAILARDKEWVLK